MNKILAMFWIGILQLFLFPCIVIVTTAEVKSTDANNGTVLNIINTTAASEIDQNSEKNFTLSPQLLDMGYNFLKRSSAFEHYSKEEIYAIIQELESWEAPEYYQRKFPYYQSGFDYDDRPSQTKIAFIILIMYSSGPPVWISELGKYDMRGVVEKGPEALAIFDKYVLQAGLNILKSIHEHNSPEREVTGVVFLIDYDGLDTYQITHLPTVTYALRIARIYADIMKVFLDRCIIINANFVGELAVNFLRPILGGVLERVEVYGTNKSRWVPVLLKALPKSALPSWYGGNVDFTPVKIFG